MLKILSEFDILDNSDSYDSYEEFNIKADASIIIMDIFKCYFSREHISLSYKNCVNMELGKTNRSKALRVMENHT